MGILVIFEKSNEFDTPCQCQQPDLVSDFNHKEIVPPYLSEYPIISNLLQSWNVQRETFENINDHPGNVKQTRFLGKLSLNAAFSRE